jgi:aspartate carbamoyltransferase catalytic subunit
MHKGKDLISIKDLTKEEILHLLDAAAEMKKRRTSDLLKGCLLASCFFEPSTRTRLSFEAAMTRHGGGVIGFADGGVSSAKKGESLSDGMRVIGSYADVVVIRHPQEGSAAEAANATVTPVINAGDGANEHPTQTLLDLFTIQECQQKLEGLNIAFVGDLKYARTVHSLAIGLSHFKPHLSFISPASQALPEKVLKSLKETGTSFSFHTKMDEVIPSLDILYMTRIQHERYSDPQAAREMAKEFTLTPRLLEKKKKNLKVLAPLPRLEEIVVEVDALPEAWYFHQAENGVYVRAALLRAILGR